MNRRNWLWLASGGVFGGCVPMGGVWTRSWGGATVERADAIARASGGRGWAAWESGSLRKSWRTHYRGPVLSVTKAMAGLACARAVGEGWLDLDEPAAETLTEWSGDPLKSRITTRHLLQMTAGLDDGAGRLYRRGIADKGRVALALPLVDPVGARFRYGPACWEVLAELLHRKASARGGSLEGFLSRAVMRPLGLSSPEWRADAKGRFFLSTGAELNVTEMGRLGRAIGRLAGGSAVGGIPASAFRDVTRPSSVNPMFGGGVWSNQRGSRGWSIEVEEELDPPKDASFWRAACLSRGQPSTMLALIGSAGQRVFIWPDEGRVIARLGFSGSWRDAPLLQVV